MSDTIQQIITERETIEALNSRYNKTINRHRWTNLDNIKLSTSEIIAKYISECDEEDAGIYRNHNFNLTSYQKHWHSWLMQKEYKYMITIKLPHYEIDGFKRTTNQKKAIEQLRKLIREIEQVYTNHKHWERDAFDFNLVFEHGKSGFWHTHLVVVANTMNHEAYYNKLQEAINVVLNKHKLFKSCIELTYVYDEEGLCIYLTKELKEQKTDDDLKNNYSYLSSLSNLFHVNIKEKKQSKPNDELNKMLKLISAALDSKRKHILFIPNPINKLKRI